MLQLDNFYKARFVLSKVIRKTELVHTPRIKMCIRDSSNLDIAVPRILGSLLQNHILAIHLDGRCIAGKEIHVDIVVLHEMCIRDRCYYSSESTNSRRSLGAL